MLRGSKQRSLCAALLRVAGSVQSGPTGGERASGTTHGPIKGHAQPLRAETEQQGSRELGCLNLHLDVGSLSAACCASALSVGMGRSTTALPWGAPVCGPPLLAYLGTRLPGAHEGHTTLGTLSLNHMHMALWLPGSVPAEPEPGPPQPAAQS